jgi:hypothetical protein
MAKPLFNFTLPESDPAPLSNEAVTVRFQMPEVPKRAKVPNAAVPEVLGDESYLTAARRYVRENETSGRTYNRPYQDDEGNWTIGVGHLIQPGEMERFAGRALTGQEIEDLFTEDFDKRTRLAKKELGKTFDKLSPSLKVAAIDGFFRGDLSGSPDTLELMAKGKFAEAAVEFLDNDEYRASLAKIKSGEAHGVAPRMERIAAAIAAEASKK